MDMIPHLEAEVIELLSDDEYLVRAEAAQALERCTSEEVIEALRERLADRSVAVQEAAEQSLQEIGRRVMAAGKANSAAQQEEQMS